MYFASIPYHLQKVLPINCSFFTAILSRQAMRSNGVWQEKTAAWRTNSLRAQPVILSSRKVPPRKQAREALRDKTKSCCTGLTCRHNNTKS